MITSPERVESDDATLSGLAFDLGPIPRVDRYAINPRLNDGTPSAFNTFYVPVAPGI
jgi:hypothetical protein